MREMELSLQDYMMRMMLIVLTVAWVIHAMAESGRPRSDSAAAVLAKVIHGCRTSTTTPRGALVLWWHRNGDAHPIFVVVGMRGE